MDCECDTSKFNTIIVYEQNNGDNVHEEKCALQGLRCFK